MRKHFNENRKVRIIHSEKSRLKHECLKTICVMVILKKYKSKKIYTEYPLGKRIADVYFEDKKDKYAIEVQKLCSQKYIKDTESYYLDKDINPIIIKEKEISDNLDEIWDQISQII